MRELAIQEIENIDGGFLFLFRLASLLLEEFLLSCSTLILLSGFLFLRLMERGKFFRI